jgi:Protein of unknown function (DUF1064)
MNTGVPITVTAVARWPSNLHAAVADERPAPPTRSRKIDQMKTITDGQIADAYQVHGSVWKVGEALGISGQTVSRRMKNIGITVNRKFVSDIDRDRIVIAYQNAPIEGPDLDLLSKELGRTRQFICRIAGKFGLTKRRPISSSSKRKISLSTIERWKLQTHPKGFLGKNHADEAKSRISSASKRSWSTQKTFGIGNMSPENLERKSARMALMASLRPAEKNYSRAKGGRRQDLGNIYFRSSWEANYARYLNLLIRLGAVEKWEFEPVTFWFEGIRRGTISYKPDFRVYYKDDPVPEYVEIKGWVVEKDRTKWRRMAKYHPNIKLVIIKAKEFYALKRKWESSIPNWETARLISTGQRTPYKRRHG